MEKYLPKNPGKHDILIVLAIVVPLVIGGVVWAILEGGYAEPVPPVTPIATPTASPAVSTPFVITV
jgi:hypothetical protein